MKQSLYPREHEMPMSDLKKSELAKSCESQTELRREWVSSRGWTASHTDEGHLEDFGTSALVRRSLVSGADELQIVRVADVFVESQTIRVWEVAANVLAVAKAFGGYRPQEEAQMDIDTAYLGYQPLLVTDSLKHPSFLMLRDSSTCATIAGPSELVCRFVAQASVDYDFYVGIPRGGLSYGDDRRKFDPGMSRSEALRRDREALRRIRAGHR